jgi:hypothetical protein
MNDALYILKLYQYYTEGLNFIRTYGSALTEDKAKAAAYDLRMNNYADVVELVNTKTGKVEFKIG